MGTILPGQVLRIAVRQTCGDTGEVINVLHVKAAGATAADDEDVLEAIGTWVGTMYANIEGYLTNSQSATDIKVDLVQFDDGKESIVRLVGITTFDGYSGGTGVNNPVPEGAAVCITFPTNTPKCRGRKFFGVLDNSILGATGLMSDTTAFINWAADFLGGFVGGSLNFTPVVAHPKLLLWIDLLTAVVRNVFAYQRRRKRGVGK